MRHGRSLRWRSSCAILLVVSSLAGCGGGGDPYQRGGVSGTVSLDGSPVPFGEIYFKGPVDDKDQTPQSMLSIRDGKFESVDGNHPGVGQNTVRVTIYADDPAVAEESGADVKTKGYWEGQAEVGGDAPLSFDIKTAELQKI